MMRPPFSVRGHNLPEHETLRHKMAIFQPSFRGEAIASRNARRDGVEPGIQR
jgi:hypothetical protein